MVTVESGMAEGQDIVFENEADEIPDSNPGDVIFRIQTIPHKRFSRNGNDLNMKMSISLLEVSNFFFFFFSERKIHTRIK
jgi:DnaJ-class molecular chaperone